MSSIDIVPIAYETRTCRQNRSNDVSGDHPLRGYSLFYRSFASTRRIDNAYKEWMLSPPPFSAGLGNVAGWGLL
jgi:hypothetical protein